MFGVRIFFCPKQPTSPRPRSSPRRKTMLGGRGSAAEAAPHDSAHAMAAASANAPTPRRRFTIVRSYLDQPSVFRSQLTAFILQSCVGDFLVATGRRGASGRALYGACESE